MLLLAADRIDALQAADMVDASLREAETSDEETRQAFVEGGESLPVALQPVRDPLHDLLRGARQVVEERLVGQDVGLGLEAQLGPRQQTAELGVEVGDLPPVHRARVRGVDQRV